MYKKVIQLDDCFQQCSNLTAVVSLNAYVCVCACMCTCIKTFINTHFITVIHIMTSFKHYAGSLYLHIYTIFYIDIE